jgi:hypothetical protein
MRELRGAKTAIFGLRCLVLPLAVEFGKVLRAGRFDINAAKIDELRNRGARGYGERG